MAIRHSQKIIITIISILGVLVIVAAAAIGLVYTLFQPIEPTIKDKSVLVLSISGEMPDYSPDGRLIDYVLGSSVQSFTSILTQLRKAKVDKRISAVLLNFDSLAIGWGKADELREALIDLRQSKKPVYAYMEYGDDREYYIATACDRIYVAPVGDLFINGFAVEATFYRGALDKLGIYGDVYQIGRYKNFPDQFTRKEMSEAERGVVNAMLDDLFTRYVETIAAARNRTSEQVKALIDVAPINAKVAQTEGLIDGAKYRDEVENELKQKLGYKNNESLNLIGYSTYRMIRPQSVGLDNGDQVAIIFASGPIASGQSYDAPMIGQSVGSDTVTQAIKDASENKKVKAIVLRVDSSGGTIYASGVIGHAVEEAKKIKPVVVSMGDVAASGGYYISCSASRIIAEPSTITGSIGIFAGKPVMKGFYDWIGINNEYVLRGKNAGMFRETEPFTAGERAAFEAQIKHSYYDDFLPTVAHGRSREVSYIDSIAQGRVWSGAQAKSNGLIDEFGGLEKAIDVAKSLAGIPAENHVRRIVYPFSRTALQKIFNWGEASPSETRIDSGQKALIESLPVDVRRTLRYVTILEQMKRGEVMAMMPFELEIK